MYNFNGGGQRKAGLGYTKRPREQLLSTFNSPSVEPDSQTPKPASERRITQDSARATGDLSQNDSVSDGEDEISRSKAPSVTTSPRARARRRTPIPEMNHGGNHDDFVDTDTFAISAAVKTKPKALVTVREDGDIVPTNWISKKKERDEETQKLLKEKNSTRLNPQHVRGAGFDSEAPGLRWDKGATRRKKLKTTYKTKLNRSEPDSQKKAQKTSLDTEDEGEDKDKLTSAVPKPSVTQITKDFIDPTKRYIIPAKEKPRAFRDPFLAYPLPPKEVGNQSGNDCTSSLKSRNKKSKESKDPTEISVLPEKPFKSFVKTGVANAKGLVSHFEGKYISSSDTEEPESQSQAYYVNDSNGEISNTKPTSNNRGSKKQKTSSVYPRTEAIDLSTPKPGWRGKDDLSSPPNDFEGSIVGSQSSTIESQFPSSPGQVRHMEDIGLELKETKLREQAKKRKQIFETADMCLLCHGELPPRTLDQWKYDDGELRPIRMAEWTEICNKHKAADLQKEWEMKGYPVIEWRGLKKRVEKHHQFLVDIVENKVPSPFREVFSKQQKEIRGNTALLLRKDHQLQYPGYYGPRGSGILLHEITVRLASFIGDAGKKDGLIAQGGVAAFIQTVLVPELGVRLIMEDMHVKEAKARTILDESREIGEKLNMDEFTEDIYDDEDGPWFDISAKTPEVAKKKKTLLDLIRDDGDDDEHW